MEHQDLSQGLHSLFRDINQARVCVESWRIPSMMIFLSAILCWWEKPQTLVSWTSTTINKAVRWAKAFLCGLARLPDWTDWRMLNNGQGYESFNCLGTMGEPAPKLVRFFVVLTQADPCPKLPGQMGALSWLWSLSALPAVLSAQILLSYIASRCSWQSFWSDSVGAYDQE